MSARRSLLAVLALGAGACSSATPPPTGYLGDGSVFIPPTPDADVEGGATSCGPGDGGASGDDGGADGGPPDGGPADGGAAAWAGTWQYVSGSQGDLCGGSLAVVATEGFLDITPSASGRLLTVIEDGCPFTFDLACGVATEEPDQACAAWAIPTIPAWTLTMQADGTLREQIGGQVVVNGEICTLSGGATLVRQ
ncbi:MAG TPA: hypothetical protein VHL80_13840 [Polyangia bacterium]|nr:hypothetical protein [Polyangia bacterium]